MTRVRAGAGRSLKTVVGERLDRSVRERMRVLITCGPSSVFLDRVRRLTNHSTGELGAWMAESLVAAGCEVVCLRGEGATHPAPLAPVEVESFATNEELERAMQKRVGWADVVLHAAAMSDFRLEKILLDGREVGEAGKIASSVQEMQVYFRQERKAIASLREWFPGAVLVGWKYEVEGREEEAVEKGIRQVRENRLDACVVNGPACGETMIWVTDRGEERRFRDRREFVGELPFLVLP